MPIPSVLSVTASVFLAADALSQPPACQTYEEHIESWCDNAPSGENRVQLKNQILDAFYRGADLDLRDQTDIVSLPAGLWVAGNLDLRGCSGLEALPEGLHVVGHACFSGCTALTALPEGLHVGGHVNIYGCTNLAALPQTFHFGGSVNLQGSSSLRELPVGWTVNGNLDISFCTRLSILEVEWDIRGSLNAHHCTNLTGMRGSLRADGDLNFYACSELAFFPDNLAFGGGINLSFCREVKALHPSIMAPRANPQVVRLGGSGLPRNVLESLGNNISISNVRFDTSIPRERVASLRGAGTEAAVQSPSRIRSAFPLTSLPELPTSDFERVWFYEADQLFDMAMAESLSAVSSSSLPSSEPMLPYEDLCSISIDALEKQGVDAGQPCPITLVTAERPVFVEPAIYEYAAIRRHYEGGGTNPLTRLPISPSEVMRVVMQDAPPTQSTRQTEPLRTA
jgi:hypothetical protein